MAVLVTATVGFGSTLIDAPTFSLVGASDNNCVGEARGNVTSLLVKKVMFKIFKI